MTKLRGEVAELSVTHPVLGTELLIGAHSIRIGPEQYLALVDELCQIAFLAPHLGAHVQSLAREIGVREVSQYVVWQAEADRAATQRISAQAIGPQTVQRTRPKNQSREREKHNEGINTADSDGRAANARGRNDSPPGLRPPRESDDYGIAQNQPGKRLPGGESAANTPQHARPQDVGS
jgi:hypothetical protein